METTGYVDYQAFRPARASMLQKRRRLAALALGASCVIMIWGMLSAISQSSLGSALVTTRATSFTSFVAPRSRSYKSFAESPELKSPPSLKAPQRPATPSEVASTNAAEPAGAWKAPDKAELNKQEEIRAKAEIERKRMEQQEKLKKLRDARREIRDFANSLNDLYDDELGPGVLPSGVIPAAKAPKDSETRIGFNPTAELLNSRAAMIGFFLVLIIEGLTGKGILTFFGLKIGSG